MYLISGHDNGVEFFKGRSDVRRCPSCGNMLDRAHENIGTVRLSQGMKLDVSYSYDGIMVVSRNFLEAYDSGGMSGLVFHNISGEFYAAFASKVVEYDATKGVRFLDKCAACGQFDSVVGLIPVYLVAGSGDSVGTMEFARTDLEFGSGDGRSPGILCGDGAASLLQRSKLRGMELKRVAM